MIISKRSLPKRSRHGRSPYEGKTGKSSPDKVETHYKSASEPALDSSRVRFWLDGPFPPGLTVDELASYRRRRLSKEIVQDTLKPNSGSFAQIKSEYTKHYKPYPVDVIIQAYRGLLMDNWFLRKFRGKRRKSPEIKSKDNYRGQLGDVESEQQYQYVAHPGAERAELRRKDTQLHLEGEFYRDGTENQDSYRGYENTGRMEPIKQPGNLRMDGEMETSTEQGDQYGPKTVAEKAHLLRRGTNIQIPVDDMETRTESKDRFVQFENAERAEPLRHPETLRMEGEREFRPEYEEQYRDPSAKRPPFPRPKTHLRTEGEFEPTTEKGENFVEFDTARPLFPRPGTSLQPEGEFHSATEKGDNFVGFETDRPYFPRPKTHLQTEGAFSPTTEKGDNFVDFDANRPLFPRPPTSLRTEGDFDPSTEQAANFVDFNADRPYFPRPKTHLQNEGEFEATTEKGENFVDFKPGRPDFPRPKSHLQPEGEFGETSEQKANYKNIPDGARSENARPPTSMRLEGKVGTDPEYRSTYLNHPRERAIAGKIPDRLRRPSDSGYKDKMSENRQNFVRHENVLKSDQNRPKTHLRMEGDFYANSEQKSNYTDRPAEEKNFAARKLYKEGPDHINFDGYGNDKSFQVLSVSPNNSAGNVNKRTRRKVKENEENKPSYRLEVCPADGTKTSDEKPFVVIPDANNNNIQPQSNWTKQTERRRHKDKWVPSWAGEDKQYK